MLFSYTETLHVHKPTFLRTTLTNQNYIHETIKSRLNAGLCVCVCVCLCACLCVSQNEPLLRTICPYCLLTILMKDVCNMNKYLHLQLAGYMKYFRLREYLWFWLMLYIFQDFFIMMMLRSHTLFYNDDIEIS